ncbi:MAG: hypothetical protein K2G16_07485 [Lachnospiraceae bacterium]|nr:hypothetical protein [Lachnospiraceae bacterium]
MNISALGTHASYKIKSFYVGNLSMMGGAGLKSEQEKLQRRQKTDSEISFWEGRKESLKSMKCDGIEDIAKKLDMFHTYEDEIAAAKAAYNKEQMFHVLDEAEEIGKKIAESVEKTEPKTPEERKEDMVDEALGIEGGDGMLEEILDEATEAMEELQDAMPETVDEVLSEETQDMGALAELPPEEQALQYGGLNVQSEEQKQMYRPFDIRI